MSREQNQQAIEAYWRAFESLDVDGAMRVFADGATYENTSISNTARGKDEIRVMWSEWFGALAQGTFTTSLDNLVVGDDNFALEWTVTATLDGTIGETTGSGGTFEVRGASVGTIKDGLITGNRDYSNMAASVAASADA